MFNRKLTPLPKIDAFRKCIIREFFNRMKKLRVSKFGSSFYFKDFEYNKNECKELFTGMQGFGITEEYYDQHAMEFFIMINSVKKFNEKFDEKTREFRTFIDNIRSGKNANKNKFGEFFGYEII